MLACLHFSSQVWNEEGASPLFLWLHAAGKIKAVCFFGSEMMLMVRGRIQVVSRCLPKVLFGMEGQGL